MAVIVPPKQTSQSDNFSISKFISKLRSKRVSKRGLKQHQAPKDLRPPLKPSPLPLVLPEHQRTLSNLGWTTMTFPQPQSSLTQASATTENQDSNGTGSETAAPNAHPLQQAYQDLFRAVQQFFDLPDDEKLRLKHRLGSEEGWSKIPGEKEFITLRTLAYTPDILKAPAKRYWDLMGSHLSSTLGRISTSLDLPDAEDQGLRKFVGPCARMGEQEEDKTSTMLRIFRYEGWEEKVVAEAHADLGLLSCVVGDVPGLEVWDGRNFFDVERHYHSPAASMLVGRQLERYSNFRYPAGGHRVVSYGAPPPIETLPTAEDSSPKPRYRHSIVFVLRAHEPVIVDSNELETEITGKWEKPVRDVTAGKMYEQIRSKHFNINIGMEEREKQRSKIREGKNGKETGKEATG